MRTCPHPEMTELLAQFPLIYKTKLDFWPDRIDAHLRTVYRASSTGEQACIEFLLSVLDHTRDWSKEGFRNFNFVQAVATWGGGQNRNVLAVTRWALNPFRP